MLESLSQRLGRVMQKLKGQARLTEEDIAEALREVRLSLLEADAALPMVKDILAKVKDRALGQEVQKSLTPGQAVVGVVAQALADAMGKEASSLKLFGVPAVVALLGLQGSGKTTTAAKLALFLQKSKKKVLLASADVWRPAAIEQLKTLSSRTGTDFFATEEKNPLAIAKAALDAAKRGLYDVLILDTAGRLTIDEAMMEEIRRIVEILSPSESLLVVDAMQGQDALSAAKAFAEAVPVTGLVLTKLDADTRGGAALSAVYATGKPIKFAGVSEKPEGLEPFDPQRMAERVLGMGDVVGLVQEARKMAEAGPPPLLRGKKTFDLEDFRTQIAQIRGMGGLESLMDKLPQQVARLAKNPQDAEKSFGRMEAIISSMTPKERRHPDLLKASRKRRVASGSGASIQEVNQLLKQFEQMQTLMKQMKKGGMQKLMRAFSALGGR